MPILVDPSHALGRANLIFIMSCAAIATGGQGLMIEAHYDPQEAVVDGSQAIVPEELEKVIKACNNVHQILLAEKAFTTNPRASAKKIAVSLK